MTTKSLTTFQQETVVKVPVFYTINADGSGDFANINQAMDWLNNTGFGGEIPVHNPDTEVIQFNLSSGVHSMSADTNIDVAGDFSFIGTGSDTCTVSGGNYTEDLFNSQWTSYDGRRNTYKWQGITFDMSSSRDIDYVDVIDVYYCNLYLSDIRTVNVQCLGYLRYCNTYADNIGCTYNSIFPDFEYVELFSVNGGEFNISNSKLDASTFASSGSVITPLEFWGGGNHTVSYCEITNWSEPTGQGIGINNAGSPTHVTVYDTFFSGNDNDTSEVPNFYNDNGGIIISENYAGFYDIQKNALNINGNSFFTVGPSGEINNSMFYDDTTYPSWGVSTTPFVPTELFQIRGTEGEDRNVFEVTEPASISNNNVLSIRPRGNLKLHNYAYDTAFDCWNRRKHHRNILDLSHNGTGTPGDDIWTSSSVTGKYITMSISTTGSYDGDMIYANMSGAGNGMNGNFIRFYDGEGLEAFTMNGNGVVTTNFEAKTVRGSVTTSLGVSGASHQINFGAGDFHYIELGGNLTTLSYTGNVNEPGRTGIVQIYDNTGGGYTVTNIAGDWPNGQPSLGTQPYDVNVLRYTILNHNRVFWEFLYTYNWD